MLQDYDTSFRRLYFSQPPVFFAPALSLFPVPTFSPLSLPDSSLFLLCPCQILLFFSSLVRPVARSKAPELATLATDVPSPIISSHLAETHPSRLWQTPRRPPMDSRNLEHSHLSPHGTGLNEFHFVSGPHCHVTRVTGTTLPKGTLAHHSLCSGSSFGRKTISCLI
ncbi:hypothetical protein TNCV_4491021 [Trichonephila clavipes]|nr:hypothetical protein TNCV_4491021 [Trichonephila clavipes]